MVSPVTDRDSRGQKRRGEQDDPIRLTDVVHVGVIVCNGRVDFKYCSRIINMVMKWSTWITNGF